MTSLIEIVPYLVISNNGSSYKEITIFFGQLSCKQEKNCRQNGSFNCRWLRYHSSIKKLELKGEILVLPSLLSRMNYILFPQNLRISGNERQDYNAAKRSPHLQSIDLSHKNPSSTTP